MSFELDTSQPCQIPTESDIKVIKILKNGKCPILLVYSSEGKEHFIMKMFPYKEGLINTSYSHESRFKDLSHENVISIIQCEQELKASYEGRLEACVTLPTLLKKISFKEMGYL